MISENKKLGRGLGALLSSNKNEKNNQNFKLINILIIIFKKQSKTNFVRPGFISCIYLIGYSFGRFWIEALRTDPLCLGGLPPFCNNGIRIAQFISIFLFSSGLIGIFFLRLRTYNSK